MKKRNVMMLIMILIFGLIIFIKQKNLYEDIRLEYTSEQPRSISVDSEGKKVDVTEKLDISSTSVAASNLKDTELENYEDADDSTISPFTEKIIFDDGFHSSYYSREFWVCPVNGKNLNIYVENQGNNSVEVDVYIGGTSLNKVTLQPNKSYLYSLKDITYENKYRLTTNDRTGSKMRGIANAKQFN